MDTEHGHNMYDIVILVSLGFGLAVFLYCHIATSRGEPSVAVGWMDAVISIKNSFLLMEQMCYFQLDRKSRRRTRVEDDVRYNRHVHVYNFIRFCVILIDGTCAAKMWHGR